MLLALADLIAIFHGAVTITVLTLSFLAIAGLLRHHPRWEAAYFIGVFLMGGSIVWLKTCFLTLWEQRLRLIGAPQTAYQEGFIEHYLSRIGLHANGLAIMWFSIALLTIAVLASIVWHMADRQVHLA